MNVKKKLFVAAMLLAPLVLTAAVCGDETTRIESPPGDQPHGITVAGEGKVTGEPDLAVISLGVNTLAPTVAEARDRAAQTLQAMVDSAKANGIDEKDLQTNQLSIGPEYDYRNNEPVLRGFRITNTLTVKIRDIDNTSKVLDDAVVAGGDLTQVQGISFTIDDPTTLQATARDRAVADARTKAEALASAGGVKVGRPIQISESSYQPIPYAADAALAERSAAGAVPSTPIEAGELDVLVTVSVTFEIE